MKTPHDEAARAIKASVAIVTLSDTRDESTDTSGRYIRDSLTNAGHAVADFKLLKDDPAAFSTHLERVLADASIDAVITNGGTGIARRDNTIAVVERLIDLPLPGFGELFRMLSYAQVGPAAMMSRAVGGIARGKPIFALPGSTKACELAMEKLILPQLPHLVYELQR